MRAPFCAVGSAIAEMDDFPVFMAGKEELRRQTSSRSAFSGSYFPQLGDIVGKINIYTFSVPEIVFGIVDEGVYLISRKVCPRRSAVEGIWTNHILHFPSP
uniref:Uncharacterized protein n=1 Tax=Nelumbo nucifera TaxID=4432 RepID=A0A822Z8X3_NELNU|nr:TPA_asm: hypothetical protein HUJ06_008609 [Nelumbo nucifera]